MLLRGVGGENSSPNPFKQFNITFDEKHFLCASYAYVFSDNT